MAKDNLAFMFTLDDQLREKVYDLYVNSNATPVQLSRKFHLRLDVIKKWEKEGEWAQARASRQIEGIKVKLDELNIVEAEELPKKMYGQIKKIIEGLDEILEQKLGSNSLAIYKQVIALIAQVNKVEADLQERLKLSR